MATEASVARSALWVPPGLLARVAVVGVAVEAGDRFRRKLEALEVQAW